MTEATKEVSTNKDMKAYRAARRKEVEAEKELFRNASPEQRRVFIARDVLAQVKAKHIISSQDIWVDRDIYEQTKHEQLKDAFLDQDSCHCCALGAAFMCLVERENEVTSQELWRDFPSAFFARLKDFFGEEQMHLIELYFEGRNAFFGQKVNDKILGENWVCFHKSPHTRLKLIMENIANNNGTFVPSMLTW